MNDQTKDIHHSSKPEPSQKLDAPGAACVLLTPLIHRKMRSLTTGDILEVTSDDPASREGVPAWSRITGNLLIHTEEIDSTTTVFYLRKK